MGGSAPLDDALRVGPPPWSAGVAPPVERTRLQSLADAVLERCRGEGPANCVSRCPLHVDARNQLLLARDGRFREALQLIRQKLPFPGILGHLCTHPCELHCKRIDEDGAVPIREIERFLATWEQGPPRHLLDVEPPTGFRVAVVGSGPAGLLAAHDLARHGHRVTLIERAREIGGSLLGKIPRWRLPGDVVERDISVIAALGIVSRTGVEIGRNITLAELLGRHDAVILALGNQTPTRLAALGLPGREGLPTVAVDPLTCATGLPDVFAAGDLVSGPSSVVEAMALGRRAAESAHLAMRGVDPRIGREPVEPRELLWRLHSAASERQTGVRAPDLLGQLAPPLDAAQVVVEAGRCLDCHCDVCMTECEFLSSRCASPPELARRVESDLVEARVDVFSCNVCSFCARVCPESLDIGALLLEARRELVRRGAAPLPQHRRTLRALRAGVSRTFTLVMAEPGRQRSRHLFFTGCALPAASPENTIAAYDELRRAYPGTGVLMCCCGAPARVLGIDERFSRVLEGIGRLMTQVGGEELIVACPECLETLQAGLPDVQIRSLWAALGERWRPPRLRDGVVVSLHDSCRSRDDTNTHDGVRSLISAAGARVEEIDNARDKAHCCGVGGAVDRVVPELARRIGRRRANELPEVAVTACSRCRAALAREGKDAVDLLDFLLADEWRLAARRKPVGSFHGWANRLRTKLVMTRLQPLAPE